MFDRITFEPGKMGGKACIRSMRMPVCVVLDLLADGASHQEILAEYPYLEPEDIKQCLEYAAWLSRSRLVPV
jgi:uncharacterized protein (DUF433 family)